MPFKERQQLIKALEEQRGTRIICYITGDRQPQLDTKIGMDVFPFFYDVCSRMETDKDVDLFVYSTGGATMAAWGLGNLLREFFADFSVLIPFKALSAATLLSLGAKQIFMTRAAQLSPVDPTITSPFNPTLSLGEGTVPQFLGVSVEDVIGFLDLVRKEAKIESEDNLTEVVKLLSDNVKPLALGSVYRAKEQIRLIARKLLQFHMNPETEASQIETIVAALTRELYSHDYLISRKEAKDVLGLKIANMSDDVETAMMALFRQYADDLELRNTYSSEAILGSSSTKVANLERAYIESTEKSFVFRTRREVKRTQMKKEGITFEAFQERAIEEGWQEIAIK